MPPQDSGSSKKKVIPDPKREHGGGRNDGDRRGNGRNSDNQGGQALPSPWLGHPLHPNGTPSTHKTAGFVEYLRWMRSPDGAYKDLTKVQILQIAEEAANYRARLETLNRRLKQMAGSNNWFEVTCPWRMRVGGTKGPESILLPAFDAWGLPYIPSSTLRGVARSYAIRHFMQEEKWTWEKADRHVEAWFGHLEGKEDNRAGKVIFFDAYPTPSPNGGLRMDMANNLWRWDGDNLGSYQPNPNPFFSLRNVSWLVGLRPLRPEYAAAAQQVRAWLIAGLAQGIGSQVNTGYGVLELKMATDSPTRTPLLDIEFDVQGQQIHGAHRLPFRRRNGVLEVDRQGNFKANTRPEPEVRATAVKSMLRYWFRVFARGVLPGSRVRELEAQIFGAIEPQPTWGWLGVKVTKLDSSDRNIQSGRLQLFATHALPASHTENFQDFCRELSWLMMRLGGIGQGARRPRYEREGNPKVRGCELTPYSDEDFWEVPTNPQQFARLFRQRLTTFYQKLGVLADTPIHSQRLLEAIPPTSNPWAEAADRHCRILVYQGEATGQKKHALAVLHSARLKSEGKYDRRLCGSTDLPSPVWIANVEDKNYQVVTVFGASESPRREFVDALSQAIRIFPLS